MKEKLYYQLEPKFEPIRDGEVEKIYLDNKKLKNLTGFNNYTSLEKGIEEIINSPESLIFLLKQPMTTLHT